MRGILLVEFIEMVETKYSIEMSDKIITQADLASEGAYTTVGNYDDTEIFRMVEQLAKLTNRSRKDILISFGRHMFSVLRKNQHFFGSVSTTFDFLKAASRFIRTEIDKLYEGSTRPEFIFQEIGEDTLVLDYQSPIPLGYLVCGMIQECQSVFGEDLNIQMDEKDELGHNIVFRVSKK